MWTRRAWCELCGPEEPLARVLRERARRTAYRRIHPVTYDRPVATAYGYAQIATSSRMCHIVTPDR